MKSLVRLEDEVELSFKERSLEPKIKTTTTTPPVEEILEK